MGLTLETFLAPVSDDEPCGVDLDAAGDLTYYNYLIAAEDRLPQNYLDLASGAIVYDRGKHNLADEERQIGGLLERSRDLKLFVVLAQFYSVNHKLQEFIDCISAIEQLLITQWNAVHPTAMDGDFSLRMASIEGLDDRSRVSLPWMYFPIVQNRQYGPITYRSYELASKPEAKWASETPLPLKVVIDALDVEGDQAQFVLVHDGFVKVRDTLKRIRTLFMDKTDYNFAPIFSNTLSVAENIIELLAKNVPAIANRSVVLEDAAHAQDDDLAVSGSDGVHSFMPMPGSAALAGIAISNHNAAASALREIESYLRENEPSSPALILVNQAVSLFGRPLIEILETLAPSKLDLARISLDSKSIFTIPVTQIRKITETIELGARVEADSQSFPRITSRQDALVAIEVLERFMLSSEPSSPLPLLLSKARSMMGKNFSAIMEDMFAPAQQAQ